MKLACETCPWGSPDGNDHDPKVYRCHHVGGQVPYVQAEYWCSLHPAAPKPIYEYAWFIADSREMNEAGGALWEPFHVDGAEGFRDSDILWRRIVGYTKGGE